MNNTGSLLWLWSTCVVIGYFATMVYYDRKDQKAKAKKELEAWMQGKETDGPTNK